MTAIIVDGKILADAWLADIGEQGRALGVPVHMAAVCGGSDEGLRKFIALKRKAAESIGVVFSSYFFDTTDETGAHATIKYLAGDEDVQGIFVELPLPTMWDSASLLALIPAEKDVDALTTAASVPAPAVRALDYLLQEEGVQVRGLHAAVVGAGVLVGTPIATWLERQGAEVVVIDVDTHEPAVIASHADLIVSGVGKPGLVTGDWVKEGAMVVDFGYHHGKGDVDADSVKKKAGVLTPVPGGMGPLVVAAVLENLLTLATR